MRVHARPEGFDTDRAIVLPGIGQIDLKVNMALDDSKARQARRARMTQLPPTSDPRTSPSEELSAAPRPQDPLEDDKASARTNASASNSIVSSASELDALLEPFAGDLHANAELFPVVHLWLDLGSSFTEDEIANPIHLYEERDSIIRYAPLRSHLESQRGITLVLSRIIREARARDPSIPPLSVPPAFGYHHDDEGTEYSDSGSLMDVRSGLGPCHSDDASEYASREEEIVKFDVKRESLSTSYDRYSLISHLTKGFRPLKMVRRARTYLKRMFLLPYIPVWP